MNRVASAIVGVIATLFGLVLSPGLVPAASAAAAHGYTYVGHQDLAASTHTSSEHGPTATYDRDINQHADDWGPRGAAARPKAVPTYAYNMLARFAWAASAGTTTQEQVRRSDNELSPRPSAGVAAKSADTVVLGHYPEYVDLAKATGGRTFQVPTKVWDSMSPTQQWAANQKFLDRAIARGSNVQLATPANAAREGSFFERELQYMQSRGYSVGPDGTSLVAPGRP